MESGPASSLTGRHPLLLYVGLAYSFSWAIAGPLATDAHGVLDLHLPQAIHYLAQFGPALAAIIVTALALGETGLRDLGGRIVKWRVGTRWFVSSAGSPVALFVIAAVVARFVDGEWVNP